MLKKALVSIILLLSILIIPAGVYILGYSQVSNLTSEKVIYELPYPGILPDSPLYPVKIIRDRILEFATRDNIKKAELYLLFSDKRIAMAFALAKKGKSSLAITTLSKAEKYFLKIPSLLVNSKKQGVSPSSEFVQKLKLSNAKHKEIAESLFRELPQGETSAMTEIINLNWQINKELEKL